VAVSDKTIALKFLIPTILVVGLALALIVGPAWINGHQQDLPIICFLAAPFLGWMTWASYRKGEATLGVMGGTYKRSQNPAGFWLVFVFDVFVTALLFAAPWLWDSHG